MIIDSKNVLPLKHQQTRVRVIVTLTRQLKNQGWEQRNTLTFDDVSEQFSSARDPQHSEKPT